MGAWAISPTTTAGTAWALSSNTPGRKGKPQWTKPKPFRWDYTQFGKANADPASPDETIEMTFVKHNAALDGFNQWTLNGEAFSMETMKPMYTVHEGRRYRLKFRNASDDIHPLHLHRHSFELTRIGGKPTAGVIKDVVMLGGFPGTRIRLRGRQSRADALPLPSAIAHGFRVHGALQLRVSEEAHDDRTRTLSRTTQGQQDRFAS